MGVRRTDVSRADRRGAASCSTPPTATCSTTASPICRCARSPPRSAAARACCCSCSAARTAWSRRCWPAHARTSWPSSSACGSAGATGGPSAAAEADLGLARRAGAPRAADALARGATRAHSSSATGPWAGFAARTVRDWLELLAELGPQDDDADRTLLLAVLRGCLLDLLATGDVERTGAAVQRYLRLVGTNAPGR